MELSAESTPLPPQVAPQRVRGLRRSQLVELVRKIGGEEAERLAARERDLEMRELVALERVAELETELEKAHRQIEQLQKGQAETARYELPRLADLITEEQDRAEELNAELASIREERDALAARVTELEAGTAGESAAADLEAAAAMFAEQATDPTGGEATPDTGDSLSATGEFLADEDSEPLDDQSLQDILEDGLLASDSPKAKAAALLAGDELAQAGDELAQAGGDRLAQAGDRLAQAGDRLAQAGDEFTRAGEALLGAAAAGGDEVLSDSSEEEVDPAGGVRISDLERALISSSSEAAAANRRTEDLEARLAAASEKSLALEGQVQRLADRLAAAQAVEVDQSRAGHQTQRLRSPLVGRPELPGLVADEAGDLDLDHLLGAYVKAEERAARIDVLEEVVWRLEAGKPSSEAWRRALEQLRRACAHEQAAREEATRALHESETIRVEVESRLRSSDDERSLAQLELQTLMARYSSVDEGLQRARVEVEAGRAALADAREEVHTAGQAWSQAEEELGDVSTSAEVHAGLSKASSAVRINLEDELLGLRDSYEALCDLHDALVESQRESLEEIDQLNAEQTELEEELARADIEVQRLELKLVGGLEVPSVAPAEPLGDEAPESEESGAAAEGTVTDLLDAPPLAEGTDPQTEVARLQRELADRSADAENYERARRAFHEAQVQRDAAREEGDRLRRHLAESRQAEAAWVWSAAEGEAALEARLRAAEALGERLATSREGASASGPSATQLSALSAASQDLKAEVGALEDLEADLAELDPEQARLALAQSESALAELESVLLQLGASPQAPEGPGDSEEIDTLRERLAGLELELASARGRAGGAKDVAAGLQDRLREEHEAGKVAAAELSTAQDRVRTLEAELAQAPLTAAPLTAAPLTAERAEAVSEAASAAAELASALATLAEAQARIDRLEEGQHQAAATRDLLREEIREATQARVSAEGELQRTLAERDLARSETSADPEATRAEDLALQEVFEAELGGALGELELTQAELEATQAELEASEAELDMVRTELGVAQARAASSTPAEPTAATAAAAVAVDSGVAEAEASLAEREELLGATVAERDAARSSLAEREQALSATVAERDAAQANVTEQEQALSATVAERDTAQASVTERDQALSATVAELEAVRARLKAVETSLDAATREGDETEATLAGDLEAAHSIAARSDAKLVEVEAEVAILRADLDRSESSQATAQRAATVAGAELAASRAERDAAFAERDAALAKATQKVRQAEAQQEVAADAELGTARGRVGALEDKLRQANSERRRLETVLETHQAVQAGLEARARGAEARVREFQAEAQAAQQEVGRLEAILAAQRTVQEGLERRLQDREQSTAELRAAAAQAGRVQALEVELGAERKHRADLSAATAVTQADLESLRSQMSEAVAARATTEVELESLGGRLALAEKERDEAEASVARLIAEAALAEAEPITDVLDHPDLPESAAVSAARVGGEDSVADLAQTRAELSDLRLLLSEQEQLSIALRAELVGLQGLQSVGQVKQDVVEDVPPTDLEATVTALEEELADRDRQGHRLEGDRARLSEEVYDLGRLLESECWRGLATHRDLVRAHQSLRLLEQSGAVGGGVGPDGSADKVLAEARRSLVAEGPRDEGGNDDHQEAVAWLLTQAPQRADALAESSALLPEIEAKLRDESEALLHMRQDFRSRRKGLLEDLLTAERAVRNATDVGVETSELDRRASRATGRLGDFDAHLEVELRAREEARGMLEDLRLWLLWELGEHGVGSVSDSDPGEERVEVLELRQSVQALEARVAEEERQRRELERDAMQAMEELEGDRQRLERDLEQFSEVESKLFSADERIADLKTALAGRSTGASKSDIDQLQQQAERIASLSWDLESRESIVHWLVQELDPRVQGERVEAIANCASAIRGLPSGDGADPAELIHWLETTGGQPANGKGPLLAKDESVAASD